MPNKIVTETCPPPECNLTEKEIIQLVEELEDYYQMFEPVFQRTEQVAKGKTYLDGMLSDLSRKVTERIALRHGENVRSLQHFIGQSPWQTEPALKVHQQLIVETLGEEDGVAIIDESGMVKQGEHSVGVGWQYCGSVGKVANSQVGVYLGYASRKGYSILDGQLFLPEKWFEEDHAEKRHACGVPEDLIFQTKPEIALQLLINAHERGELPFKWVTADELYGDSSNFRDGIAEMGKWYFAEVSCSTQVWLKRPEVHIPKWSGHGRPPTRSRLRDPDQKAIRVDVLAKQIPQDSWIRAKVKEGTRGPIICDFAFLRVIEARDGLPGPEVWLVIRRNIDNPDEIKFYLSNAPADIPYADLVRISGMRWPIESIFRESKVEVGFDHYEVRSWLGWHHHMLFAFLAHHFLVRVRILFKELAPALTIYQVRLLLTSVLPKPVFDAKAALCIIRYYQRRNYTAYVSHRKTKLAHLAAYLAL